MELQVYPHPDGFGRQILSLSLSSFEAFTSDLLLPSPYFVCLLAGDASNVADYLIARLGQALLGKGLAYLCAWGPDCSRVHDLFDLAIVDYEIERGLDLPIMTSWHSAESLDEALWFTFNLACPDDHFVEACNCCLVITIGNPEWAEQVQRRAEDPEQLVRDVVGV